MQIFITTSLPEKYRLHQEENVIPEPVISEWLTKYPQAWAETGGIRLVSHRPLILVELKPKPEPASVYQYPMPPEAEKGITPNIYQLLNQGILTQNLGP